MPKKVIIIAEVGVNHNVCIDTAKSLIDVASFAGADFVKFQTFKAEELVTKTAPKAQYQLYGSQKEESQFEMLQKLELSEDAHRELFAYCKTKRIKFLSTGFDSSSIDFLINLGVDYIKIPSGEITNLPYLRHVGKQGKKVLLSTGMSSLEEVLNAIKIIEQAGLLRDQIVVLHCTSEYPAPLDELNLRALSTIREELKTAIGYSDHTIGFEAALVAVALGAEVIEKHITLSKFHDGPDHKASMEPKEFNNFVAMIRNAEILLGNPEKIATPSEIKNIIVARKSIVASKFIKVGEIFTQDNLTTKRPATGLNPMRWDSLLGRKANRNYLKDEQIEL